MAKPDSTNEVEPSTRTAFRITPSEDRLDAKQLQDTFVRLQNIDPSLQLEWRLTTTDDRVTYDVVPPQEYEQFVERTLRRLFPEATEIETVSVAGDPTPADPTAALELQGRGTRHDDWQTRLQSVVTEDDALEFPLGSIVDALADAEASVVYQVLLTPKADWQATAGARIIRLKRQRDTRIDRWAPVFGGENNFDADIEDATPADRKRIESIQSTEPKQSFVVNARAVASGPDADVVLREIGNAFKPVDGEFYHVAPRVWTDDDRIETVADHVREATCFERPSLKRRLARRLPITGNAARPIVTDPLTAPNFCLFDGDGLSEAGRRALDVTPEERSGIPYPDEELLDQYDHGMRLGYPLTTDRTTLDSPVSLPPSLQDLHTAWFGKTGSGKSTAIIVAMLWNHAVTDGPSILIDRKGDGMPIEYLKAHYAKYGDLENVYYFDCRETLPAISFFDIRDQLADGIYRTTAIENIVDHYVEMLVGIMGTDRYWSAVRSPDIIQYLVKAMFDPVHGDDAFRHRDLQEAAKRMHETRDAPPVSDESLQRMLSGVAANSKRSFDELMQGVANRIEKVPLDDRVGQLFNHVPEDDDDPHFDFRDVLDEDAVVIVDTGALREESQRIVTLVLLSELWNALRRRHRNSDRSDLPLVNLYLEEAADVASSGLVKDLLARSRSFGLSMTLAMQFPGQLRHADREAYAELLNNVSTVVTGNVAVDDDLAKQLATEDMPPSEVANRLRGLHRGQWFASLPSEFGVDEPRPFLLESAPIPAGHPESDEPLSDRQRKAFDGALDAVTGRTRLDHGLDIAENSRQSRIITHSETATASHSGGGTETETGAEADATAGGTAVTTSTPTPTIDEDARVDSALPYTKRLPDVVDYDVEKHALLCENCGSRYGPTSDDMRKAIRCCHSLDDVDRDNVPICECNLTLSVDERRQSPYTDAQLRFLQAVHTAHQKEYDPELEYDLLVDSMVRLQEYVGVGAAEVQELLDAGLLSKDCSYPHTLYTVTAEGREEAKISYRDGIEHGDGQGDLGESSLHVAKVELLMQFIDAAHVANPDSEAAEAVAYHRVGDVRLDAAGLDEDGNPVVVAEAERSNHDILRAVPHDYDKMAAQDPEEAIWLVKNREAAHDVLDALNDPPEGPVRVAKEYSRSSPPQRFNIDEPGLTEVFTFKYLRDTVLE